MSNFERGMGVDQQPSQNQQSASQVYEPARTDTPEQETPDVKAPLVRAGDRSHGPVRNLVIFLLILIVAGGAVGGYTLLKLSEHVYTVSNVNVTVRYAGLDVTFDNVQQSNTFDDDSVNGSGVARVNVTIHNPGTATAIHAINYTDVIRLLNPNATILSSNNTLVATFQPKAGETLINWVDFPLPQNTDMSTYQIVLGKSGEKPILVSIQKSTS